MNIRMHVFYIFNGSPVHSMAEAFRITEKYRKSFLSLLC